MFGRLDKLVYIAGVMKKYKIIKENNQIKVQEKCSVFFYEYWKTCKEKDFLSDLYFPYEESFSDIVFASKKEAKDWINSQLDLPNIGLYKKRRLKIYESFSRVIIESKCKHEYEYENYIDFNIMKCKKCGKHINNSKIKYDYKK